MGGNEWHGRAGVGEKNAQNICLATTQQPSNNATPITQTHTYIYKHKHKHTNIHAHACLHTSDERVLSRTRHANTADLKTVSKNSLIENDSPAAPPPESPSRPVLLCIMPAIPSPSLASCVSNTRDIDVDRKCRQRQTVAETQRCKESHSV